MGIQDPGEYYNETYDAYALGWSSDHFHFGYWYDHTRTHEESLVNTTKEVIRHLEINENDQVLDAGCGTGGSSRYIVDTFGSKVTGIMLSEVMLEQANKKKELVSRPDNLTFHNMDFTDTIFPDETYTKIFGIESVCHAENKADFVREAYRLLQPGGMLAIADGYLMRDDLDEEETDIYEKWLYGWALPNLATPDGLKKILEDQGFTNVAFHNNTELVYKSSSRLFRNSRISRILYWLATKLRIMPKSKYYSARSAYLQHFLVKQGIVGHGILVGQK